LNNGYYTIITIRLRIVYTKYHVIETLQTGTGPKPNTITRDIIYIHKERIHRNQSAESVESEHRFSHQSWSENRII